MADTNMADNWEKRLEEGLMSGDSFLDFVRGLPEYMALYGLQAPQDFVQNALTVYGSLSLEDLRQFDSFQALEDLLATFAVNDVKGHVAFHQIYTQYIKSRHTVVVTHRAEEKLKKMRDQRIHAQDAVKANEALIKAGKEKEEALRKAAEKERPSLLSEKEKEDYQKRQKKAAKELKKLYASAPHKEFWEALDKRADAGKRYPQKQFDALQAELQGMMKQAVLMPHYKEILDALKNMSSVLRKMNAKGRNNPHADYLEQIQKNKEAEQAYQQAQERLREMDSLLKEGVISLSPADFVKHTDDREIWKDTSAAHRPMFTGGSHAVRSEGPADKVLDEELKKLSVQDKEQIRRYIHDNARKFRTMMAWSVSTKSRRKLDLAATCRKACRTGGVPMRLVYTKPKRSKAKLIMFLDVSGSCKNASEMMLTFMHEMREVFPSGCDTYCFTNRLYDVSGIFRNSLDAEDSIRSILDAIPRSGAYSDYNRPLQEFVHEHFASVTKDTVVLWMGDARNNKNPSGEELMKKIAQKSKKSYWLNTETREKWNVNDSIMYVYEPYMDEVRETVTTREIVDFLNTIR